MVGFRVAAPVTHQGLMVGYRVAARCSREGLDRKNGRFLGRRQCQKRKLGRFLGRRPHTIHQLAEVHEDRQAPRP